MTDTTRKRHPIASLPISKSVMGLPWRLRWSRICLQCRRPGYDPWVGKIPWRREWQPAAVFSPGEVHGQRSLVSYIPWGQSRSRLRVADTHRQEFHNFCFRIKYLKKFHILCTSKVANIIALPLNFMPLILL